MNYLLPLLLLLALTGCSTTKKEDKLKNEITQRLFDLWDKTIGDSVSDSKTASIANKKVELKRPFELAIYFKQPDKKEDWRWTREDKVFLQNKLDDNKNIVKRSFELINTAGTEDIKALRTMAAQQGADALLIVQGKAEVESNLNAAGLSYVVLVPTLFANGNTVTSAFVTQAVLWDVRDSVVHLGSETEGEWKMKRPLFFKQEERAINKAKEESLLHLEEQLTKQATERWKG
ncbi:hypothetical protein ACJVC5_10890 [Peredibacter sp. HCB2-198]|uniref:hypothetical protein n=1 Tax=Peredibacter sp. HCB2-198 TaxID=3383025 RepID=UPI0038B67580